LSLSYLAEEPPLAEESLAIQGTRDQGQREGAEGKETFRLTINSCVVESVSDIKVCPISDSWVCEKKL
jgi:hypothetical protein